MNVKKALAITLAALTLCTALTACGSKPTTEDKPESTTSTAKENIVVGALEQNSVEVDARKHWEQQRKPVGGREFKEFTSLSTMLLELSAGRVDAIGVPTSVAKYLISQDDKLLSIEGNAVNHYHMAARTADSKLIEELNSAINALRADGTMDQLVADYITGATGEPTQNKLVKNEGGETHVVAITGDMPPMDYVAADGTPAGFNVALLNAIAEKTGCNFEIIQLDAPARLSALESGKVDLVFWIECWGDDAFQPTAEGITLSAPYTDGTASFVSYSADAMEGLKATTSSAK